MIHYSATSTIYYCSPCKSLFKVLTIEFRRGKLIHLRTEDTFAAARRRCRITEPEIASESNSSQLSSTALQSNNANSSDLIRSMHSMNVCCVFLNERCRAVYRLLLVKRELVVYILYSRHGSLQSPHTDVRNSFLCEIEEAFRSVLHEGKEGVLLNEDAIIRLHQRFLLWRSWNFAHFSRIPSRSSPSSFQPQWQTMTRRTTTTMEGSEKLSGTSPRVCSLVRAIFSPSPPPPPSRKLLVTDFNGLVEQGITT